MNFLTVRLLNAFEGRVGVRTVRPVKERMKRVLIERYFGPQENTRVDLTRLTFESVRGKVVRKLHGLVQSRRKQHAMELEEAVRDRNRSDEEGYIRGIIHVVKNIRVNNGKFSQAQTIPF